MFSRTGGRLELNVGGKAKEIFVWEVSEKFAKASPTHDWINDPENPRPKRK